MCLKVHFAKTMTKIALRECSAFARNIDGGTESRKFAAMRKNAALSFDLQYFKRYFRTTRISTVIASVLTISIISLVNNGFKAF